MLLSHLYLGGAVGFDGMLLNMNDRTGAPRRLVVLFGGEGVGKTSLLSAVAATRPGHAVAQGAASSPDAAPPFVVADWFLGDDDPLRPHPLRVSSPNAKLEGEREDAAIIRRREQALFDRRAHENGFVMVSFSGARWFSRTPVLLSAPDRTILRYDVRSSAVFDDPARADLARETKQVLSLSGIQAALARTTGGAQAARATALDHAVREALDVLLDGSGATYLGPSPARLEPLFAYEGREVELDDLPRSLRHRVAFAALPLRALAAAYPGRDPREGEGVVLIDDLEVEQDPRSQKELPSLLRRALPRVQWIVTTASPSVAMGCDVNEVMALRRMPGSSAVELHQGDAAVMH
ncbi:hypothetical protein A7982_13364 [Minicystis rosea]|nr:hypothetical protein A7982_13364 [Minicystis rosea]